ATFRTLTPDVQKADIKTQIQTKQVVELPTITRNIYGLTALSGNITATTPPNATSTDATLINPDVRGSGFNINGLRSASTVVTLDGGLNVNPFTSTIGQNVPLDAVNELNITTNNPSAGVGRASAGLVAVKTKSGTNEFHGTVYEFNRNSALASNGFDNNARGIDKGYFQRNQFGYSFGGPIRKQKAWFFSSAEGLTVNSREDRLFVVPAQSFLTGPGVNKATQDFFSQYGQLVPGQAQGSILLGQKTAPNPLPGGLFDVFRATDLSVDAGGGAPQSSIQLVNRVDWNLSNDTRITARHAFERIDRDPGSFSVSPYTGFDTGSLETNHSLLGEASHIFSPTFTMRSRLVYNRLSAEFPLGDRGYSPGLQALQFRVPRVGGVPVVFPGYLPLNPGNTFFPLSGSQNFLQVFQDFTLSRGKHTLDFGGSYLYTQDTRQIGAYANTLQVLGTTLQDAIGNLRNGTIRLQQGAIDPQGQFPGRLNGPLPAPNFDRKYSYHDLALYVTDSWSIHPRVRVTLGLRYEIYGVQRNGTQGGDSNFSFGQGESLPAQISTGMVVPTPNGELYDTDKNNFAPRIGVAWDVFGNGNTSLRGGYGIGYERNFGNITALTIQNPPGYGVFTRDAFFGGTSVSLSSLNGGIFAETQPVPIDPAFAVRHIQQNLRTAYAHFWNASLQQSLFRNRVLLSLDYTGSKGSDLYSIENLNRFGSRRAYLDPEASLQTRLNQGLGDIISTGNNAFSSYHGMTLGVDVFNLKGVNLTARYTYSKAIDNLSSTLSESSNNRNLGLLDPFHPELDRGPADFDTRQRFIVSGIWELPFGRAFRGAKKHLVDGWQVISVFSSQTGTPFTLFDSTGAILYAPRLTEIGSLDRNGSGNPAAVPGEFNSFNYLDLSSQLAGAGANGLNGAGNFSDFGFDGKGTYTAGMTGRNAFRGPGQYRLDTSIAKRFDLTEKMKVQVRFEFFNVLNHANLFTVLDQTDIALQPYVPARRDGRRQVQLAVKLIF
ncbi:MAG: TonB-dependent receptor, partial [Blastocatellia bacterium]|nr:TonB-dependent receptor [Blastocatellia bacterium]